MGDLGRLLLGLGFVLLLVGAVLILGGRLGFPLGRLPGDLHWRGRNSEVFVPLGTCLVLSLLISLLLALVRHLRR